MTVLISGHRHHLFSPLVTAVGVSLCRVFAFLRQEIDGAAANRGYSCPPAADMLYSPEMTSSHSALAVMESYNIARCVRQPQCKGHARANDLPFMSSMNWLMYRTGPLILKFLSLSAVSYLISRHSALFHHLKAKLVLPKNGIIDGVI